mmetsp:Transcript_8668/g.12808  ORF Transcript_8668/g.12808 Transcript_8668/m.12808 type:complete len:339 (+) Transcript_8668:26-1042(+)
MGNQQTTLEINTLTYSTSFEKAKQIIDYEKKTVELKTTQFSKNKNGVRFSVEQQNGQVNMEFRWEDIIKLYKEKRKTKTIKCYSLGKEKREEKETHIIVTCTNDDDHLFKNEQEIMIEEEETKLRIKIEEEEQQKIPIECVFYIPKEEDTWTTRIEFMTIKKSDKLDYEDVKKVCGAWLEMYAKNDNHFFFSPQKKKELLNMIDQLNAYEEKAFFKMEETKEGASIHIRGSKPQNEEDEWKTIKNIQVIKIIPMLFQKTPCEVIEKKDHLEILFKENMNNNNNVVHFPITSLSPKYDETYMVWREAIDNAPLFALFNNRTYDEIVQRFKDHIQMSQKI